MNCTEITTRINEIKIKKTEFDDLRNTDIPKALTLKKEIQVLISQLKEILKPVFKIEGKVFLIFQLEIGGKMTQELENELLSNNIEISKFAKDILHSSNFSTLSNIKIIHLVRLKVSDLGFKNGVKTVELYARAQKLGLELCPAEVGPYQRLHDYNQPVDNQYNIAMEPIIDRDNDAIIFNLNYIGSNLWLDFRAANLNNKWAIDHEFIFRIPDKKDNK